MKNLILALAFIVSSAHATPAEDTNLAKKYRACKVAGGVAVAIVVAEVLDRPVDMESVSAHFKSEITIGELNGYVSIVRKYTTRHFNSTSIEGMEFRVFQDCMNESGFSVKVVSH